LNQSALIQLPKVSKGIVLIRREKNGGIAELTRWAEWWHKAIEGLAAKLITQVQPSHRLFGPGSVTR